MPPPRTPEEVDRKRKSEVRRRVDSSAERRDSSRDSRRSYESHRSIGSSSTDSDCSSRRGRDTEWEGGRRKEGKKEDYSSSSRSRDISRTSAMSKNSYKKEDISRSSSKQRDEYYSQGEANLQLPRPLKAEDEVEDRKSLEKERIKKLEEELK